MVTLGAQLAQRRLFFGTPSVVIGEEPLVVSQQRLDMGLAFLESCDLETKLGELLHERTGDAVVLKARLLQLNQALSLLRLPGQPFGERLFDLCQMAQAVSGLFLDRLSFALTILEVLLEALYLLQ